MAEADVVVWYNPRCSKCRGAEQLLADYGVPAQRVFYLDNPPVTPSQWRILPGAVRDFCRTRLDQAEVTVPGIHVIQRQLLAGSGEEQGSRCHGFRTSPAPLNWRASRLARLVGPIRSGSTSPR